jgi:hypothetical protein
MTKIQNKSSENPLRFLKKPKRESGSTGFQPVFLERIRSTHRPEACATFSSLLFLSLRVIMIGSLMTACQPVERPELKGEGPLAVVAPRGSTSPEYHAPIERWRTIHMEAVNQGDFSQRECVLCHNPKTGCNRCHKYIGAKEVSVPEADLFWPDEK